jgi:hypothetical protein
VCCYCVHRDPPRRAAALRGQYGPTGQDTCRATSFPVRSGFPNTIYRVWWGSQVRNDALGDPGPSSAFRRSGFDRLKPGLPACIGASDSDSSHGRSLQTVATPSKTHTSIVPYIIFQPPDATGFPRRSEFGCGRHTVADCRAPLAIVCSRSIPSACRTEIGFVWRACSQRRQHLWPRPPAPPAVGPGQIGFVSHDPCRRRDGQPCRPARIFVHAGRLALCVQPAPPAEPAVVPAPAHVRPSRNWLCSAEPVCVSGSS